MQLEYTKKFMDEFKELTTNYYHNVLKSFQISLNTEIEKEKKVPIALGQLVDNRIFCEKLASKLPSKKPLILPHDIANLIEIGKKKYNDYFKECYEQERRRAHYYIYENIFFIKMKECPVPSRALAKYFKELQSDGQENQEVKEKN